MAPNEPTPEQAAGDLRDKILSDIDSKIIAAKNVDALEWLEELIERRKEENPEAALPREKKGEPAGP